MPGKYAPWMHLEHDLAPLPWAAKGLRRLVRKDPAVPLLPVGAKLVCQAVARKRITPVDLLHGALSRKDVVSLYRTPEGTYFRCPLFQRPVKRLVNMCNLEVD